MAMGKRKEESRDVPPVVGLGVGIVADDVLRIEHLAKRQPDVSALASLSVETVVGQQLLYTRPAAPNDFKRKIEAIEPLTKRADGLRWRSKRDHDPVGIGCCKLREDTFGCKPSVLPFGHRDNDRRPVCRCSRRGFSKLVERCDPLLDVLHSLGATWNCAAICPSVSLFVIHVERPFPERDNPGDCRRIGRLNSSTEGNQRASGRVY
jgi:hypothetical protein